jgi:hypothetical protein
VIESWRVVVIDEDGKDGWRVEGQFNGPINCAAVRDALRAGRVNALPPARWRDIEAGGHRLRFAERAATVPGCS